MSDIVKMLGNETAVVAFVGFQKQGKSTLINALIGHELLPVDSLPATATICTIMYGPMPEASMMWEGQWRRVPYEDRASYIDQNLLGDRPAPDGARFTCPSAILTTMTVLDTAGFGSSFAPHAERSRQAFLSADLLVLVCSLQRPLGKDDLEILDFARANQIPVVAVITKCDQADSDDPESDIGRVTSFVESVASDAGITLARSFAVSVRDNDNPESAVRGAVDSLREYLLTASISARVKASFVRCQATLQSSVAALAIHRASLRNEQTKTAVLLSKCHNEMELIEREIETRKTATRADHVQFTKRFEAEVAEHAVQALVSIIPLGNAVNSPADIPERWTRLLNAASVTFSRIRERIQQELGAEINAANADLPFMPGDLERLLTSLRKLPLLHCDLPRRAPSSVLRDPGFLSVTLGLHGEYVRNQMGERLFESLGRTEATFGGASAALEAFGDARVAAVEFEAARRLEAARVVIQGHYETMRSCKARLEENENELQAVRDRDEASVLAAADHQAVLAWLQEGNFSVAASHLSALNAGVVELPALSGIQLYLSGAYVDAAEAFGRSPAVTPPFDQAVARMYWISRCRETTSIQGNIVGQEEIAERDPLGAAFYNAVDAFATYTPLQELVVAAMCNRKISVTIDKINVDKSFSALFSVACIAVDVDCASKATATMLDELGAPSASVLLRENMARRGTQVGNRVDLATFSASHAELLGTEEAKIDLEDRLRAHLKGVEPDPRRIWSVRDFVCRERWQAIAL